MASQAMAPPPGRPLSLEDAVNYAVRNNISIRNARIDQQLQRAKNGEITAIALPQINGKNEFTYYPRPIVSFLPAQILNPNAPAGEFVPVTFTPNYANTASVAASQVLFDGSVLVALQARNTILYLTELGTRATEEDVRYNVRRSYQGLVIARRQFSILSQSLEQFRSILRELTILRNQGFVERIEVDRTQVQVNNLSTDSLRTANLIALSEQLLKYNMGMPISEDIILTDTAVADVMEEAQSLIQTTVDYTQRTDYNILQTQLRLNEFDLKRYRYKALPSLALFGSWAYTYANNELREVLTPSNYVRYTLVGLQLNVPIFTGLQRSYQVQQARLNVQKTQNNLENLRRTIDLQNEQSRTTLRNALLAVQTGERNLELALSVLDLARKKYTAGVGSNLEVTQAQSEYLQAQNNLFAAQLDIINATTDLQRAQGFFRSPSTATPNP